MLRACDIQGCEKKGKGAVVRRINLYFPLKMIEQLKLVKLATGMPISEIIRRAVSDWMDKQKGVK